MGELLKTEELAQRLQVKPDTIRRWVRRGLLPVMRISPKVFRFDLIEVLATLRDRGMELGGPRRYI
jgi:excisionase family DNA binding protein